MDQLLSQAGGAPVDGWAITVKEPSQFDGGSECLLDAAGRIRLVLLLAGEHFPADPDHLVGERDHRDLPVPTPLNLAQPRAERRLVALQVQERRRPPPAKTRGSGSVLDGSVSARVR